MTGRRNMLRRAGACMPRVSRTFCGAEKSEQRQSEIVLIPSEAILVLVLEAGIEDDDEGRGRERWEQQGQTLLCLHRISHP